MVEGPVSHPSPWLGTQIFVVNPQIANPKIANPQILGLSAIASLQIAELCQSANRKSVNL